MMDVTCVTDYSMYKVYDELYLKCSLCEVTV